MHAGTKTLSLVKGDQHFCFRYEIGSGGEGARCAGGNGQSARHLPSIGLTPRCSLISLVSIWQKN